MLFTSYLHTFSNFAPSLGEELLGETVLGDTFLGDVRPLGLGGK